MQFENLENEERKTFYRCTRCGTCTKGPFDPLVDVSKRTCPQFEMYGFQSHSGLGINTMARALLEGKLEPSDKFIKVLYDCIMCGNCYTACDEMFKRIEAAVGTRVAFGINVPKVVRAVRADLAKAGMEPPELYKKTADFVKNAHNRYGLQNAGRADWAKDMDIPNKGKLMYFAGCVASFSSREISQSFAKVLKSAGVEFGILGENEWCCGGPQLLNTGQVDAFKENAEHNIKALKDAGAEEVVTTCADCYRTLKYDYKEVLGNLGIKVIHSSELIARLIKEGKIKLKNPIAGKVTYQDPCQLAKVGKVCDQPREIIKSIPGIDFAEMFGNKEYTVCCGHYPFELPELSQKTALDRVGDAQAVGAKTLITACSFCKWALKKAVGKTGIKVVDIVEVVAQAMSV